MTDKLITYALRVCPYHHMDLEWGVLYTASAAFSHRKGSMGCSSKPKVRKHSPLTVMSVRQPTITIN